MTEKSNHKRSTKPDVIGIVSSLSSLPDLSEVNRTGVITNRVPAVILPEDIPTARLILRRDRLTHFEDIGAVVDRMRHEDKGHDCVIVCGKEKINAHRSVLIAHSEYFQKMLFDTGDKLMVDVPTDGIPSRGMTAIVDYMYSGDLKINYENAVDTLTTANILQMPQLTERCSDFINTLLADENLMTTLELAERTGINPLYAEAYKRLARNFYVQTKMPGFLLWDIEKVCRLLSNDHIVIETEVHVFTAAMRWMQFREEERRHHFKRLMDCVRWVYMSTDEIMGCIDQEADLLKQSDIRILLIDANWYTTLQSYNFTWKDYVIPLPRIRSLRKEDPEEVVQRMRVSLVAKHSSFDQIWKRREPATVFAKERLPQLRKSAPKLVSMEKPVPKYRPPAPSPSPSPVHAERSPKSEIARERARSNPASPKDKATAENGPKVKPTATKPAHISKKSPLGERFSIFKKVARSVRRTSKSDGSTDEEDVHLPGQGRAVDKKTARKRS